MPKIHRRSEGDKARIGFFQIRTINLPAQINYLRVPAMIAAPLLGGTFIRHHYDIRPSVARSLDKRPPEA
jgi:hypothetical protein